MPSMPSSGSSSHHLPFMGASSSEGNFLLEQSPATRASKAPSDGPSEFSSWHDDASSSLATCSAGDRTITVNTQRMRMGEHLKVKLEGMIAQRFENYLRIIQTLQNDTGKLAALECELRFPARNGGRAMARISISCNEDGTFLVYLVPTLAMPAVRGPSIASSSSAQGECGEIGDATDNALPQQMPELSTNGADNIAGAASSWSSPEESGDLLLRNWIEQVSEFGTSGQCHSLTAFFHFGYDTWKQILGDSRIEGLWQVGTAEETPAHIAEEEERPREEQREEANPVVAPPPPVEEPGVAPQPIEEPADQRPSSPVAVLNAARKAVECEHFVQAVELCTEGLALAESVLHRHGSDVPSHSAVTLLQTASGSTGPAPGGVGAAAAAAAAAAATGTSPDSPEAEAAAAAWQLLSLRASVQARLRNFRSALEDAEELISLQPTCAEGYYWQSVAMQGMGHLQEALESLMSALEYEPQNPLFSQAFNSLFEEISAVSGERSRRSRSAEAATSDTAASTAAVIASEAGVLHRGSRGRAGDALSTTTQATHLSSRSTTPTEVSAPLSRSSSNDSLYVMGAAFEDPG